MYFHHLSCNLGLFKKDYLNTQTFGLQERGGGGGGEEEGGRQGGRRVEKSVYSRQTVHDPDGTEQDGARIQHQCKQCQFYFEGRFFSGFSS